MLVASSGMVLGQPSEEWRAEMAKPAEAPPRITQHSSEADSYRHLRHFLNDRNLNNGVKDLGPLIFAAPKARWWWLRPEMDDVAEVHRRLTDVTSMSFDAEDLSLKIGLRTTGLRITLPIR